MDVGELGCPPERKYQMEAQEGPGAGSSAGSGSQGWDEGGLTGKFFSLGENRIKRIQGRRCGGVATASAAPGEREEEEAVR